MASSSNRAAASHSRSIQLYRNHCVDCHENDGRGEASRELMGSIPDFTSSEWHRARSNDRLVRSISEGKGMMPAMKRKLGKPEVVELVALVRNFRDGRQVLSDDSSDKVDPAAPPDPARPSKKSVTSPLPQPPLSAPGTADGPDDSQRAAARVLFDRFCISCHGQDGRGEPMRRRIARMPDFTALAWHGTRSDAEMTCSVLEGKGTAMPSFRGKLEDVQVRQLVAYVRSMARGLTRANLRSTGEFHRRFQRLREQMDDLDRQIRALSSEQRTARRQSAENDIETRE
ncbi:MAG TPA: c-type cytochrome [Isosphaeraceae bacterium]|nr:c-type cytochrome [Isosphaeraceae bacterium]